MKKTLILNNTYQPLGVVDWQRAITLFYLDKVNILEYYEDFELRTINKNYKCPSIVITKEFAKFSVRNVRFCRENVFIRDNFTCQYCGKKKSRNDLTLDHIIPKSKGGTASWLNCCTCCKGCNSWKADMTPQEAGMKLLNKPHRPTWETSLLKTEIPTEWRRYIWTTSLTNF